MTRNINNSNGEMKEENPLHGLEGTNKAVKLEFGRRLKGAMIEKGWNQSDLARAAEKYLSDKKTLGRYSISCYVGGKVLPRPDTLVAIARALGKEPMDLLPTKGAPSFIPAGFEQGLDLKDVGNGKVLLRVNQATDWMTALEVMKLLKVDASKMGAINA